MPFNYEVLLQVMGGICALGLIAKSVNICQLFIWRFDMENFLLAAQQFAKDEEGATAVEYGLLVALIAAIIVGTVKTLGGQINTAFQAIVTALQ